MYYSEIPSIFAYHLQARWICLVHLRNNSPILRFSLHKGGAASSTRLRDNQTVHHVDIGILITCVSPVPWPI